MELLDDTFDKIRYAIWFVRENGTNTCNFETWKKHCEMYDLLETETYSIQKEIESLRKQVAKLEAQLAKNSPLLDEAADKIDAMENYVDDVCQVICDPYRWCDDIDVLRKIEQLLRDGSKLIGDK